MAQDCDTCRPSSHTTCSPTSDQTWEKLQTWANSCYKHLTQSSPSQKPALCGSTQTIHDSIRFDSLTEGNNVRPHSVPPYVIGLAVLTMSDARKQTRKQEKRYICKEPLRFSWYCDTAYFNFYDRMLEFVKQQGSTSRRSYLKMAHVQLFQWTGKEFELSTSCVIEHRDDWARRVPTMIANHCGSKTRHLSPFYLEIHSEFEYFNLSSHTTAAIRSILRDTELRNFEDDPFWSRKILKEIFNRSTVTKIVESHVEKQSVQSKSKRKHYLIHEDSEQFVDWILQDRIRLFATFIRSNISINIFHKLKQEGSNDIKDCLIPLDKKTLKTFLESEHANRFKTNQMGYRPYSFPDPDPESEHQDIEDDAAKTDRLIPINYDANDPIGRGGFGVVYKATIHPDFHAFSPKRNEEFALKIIGDSVHQPANNEVKAWQLVVKIPHPHITPLYASWLQNNQCFMLSPLADDSLDKFLSRGRTFDIQNETEWLLEQIEGLVAGIHHIHHIGRISLGKRESLKKLERFDCGYHHDLKPANILVFQGSIFKISDFGTAKIHQLVSGKHQPLSLYTTGYAGGDSEYGAPDLHLHHRVGRPYDIWSFGCILLEILLWAFGRGGKYLKEFHDARIDDPCNNCQCSVPDSFDTKRKPIVCIDTNSGSSNGRGGSEFWYQCKIRSERFHLKACVEKNLEWVIAEAKKYEKKQELLANLGECVKTMLRVDPEERHTASNIRDRVGELRFRANFHFRHKNSKLDIDILTQPDTCRGPASPHNYTPSLSEDLSRTDTYYEDQQALNSRKRKIDDLDQSVVNPLPQPPSTGIVYVGDHLSVPMAAYNTRKLLEYPASEDNEHPTKKPRLQVPLPATIDPDELPRNHTATIAEELVKKFDDSPLMEKLAKESSSSKSSTNRSRTL